MYIKNDIRITNRRDKMAKIKTQHVYYYVLKGKEYGPFESMAEARKKYAEAILALPSKDAIEEISSILIDANTGPYVPYISPYDNGPDIYKQPYPQWPTIIYSTSSPVAGAAHSTPVFKRELVA